MTATDPANEPARLIVLPPAEALRHARPAPADSDLIMDGLTESEWQAFENALAER